MKTLLRFALLAGLLFVPSGFAQDAAVDEARTQQKKQLAELIEKLEAQAKNASPEQAEILQQVAKQTRVQLDKIIEQEERAKKMAAQAAEDQRKVKEKLDQLIKEQAEKQKAAAEAEAKKKAEMAARAAEEARKKAEEARKKKLAEKLAEKGADEPAPDDPEKPEAVKPPAPKPVKPKAVARAQIQVVPLQGGVIRNEAIVLDDFIMDPSFLRGANAKTFLNLNETDGDAPQQDQLRFMNGDRLAGTFVDISGDGKTLIWTNAWSAKPIQFDVSGIAYADLRTLPDEEEREGLAAIQFKNGDRIIGEIASLNAETLVLDTWYGGKLEIRKPMIQAINPVASRALVLYEGPTSSMEGWEHGPNNKAWRARNGELVPSGAGSIGRKIPGNVNRLRIRFHAAWTSYTSFNICFGSDNVKSAGGNCYKLGVRSSSFQLTRITTEGSSNMWNFHNSNFSSSRGKAGATYEILMDRKKKNFALLLNGQVKKQWTEPNELPSKENGIVFSIDSNPNVRISKIRVSQWDGKVPKAGEDTSAEKEVVQDADEVYFANGDRVAGEILSMAEGTMKLKTDFGEIEVPVGNVVEATFAPEKVERARRNNGDIRAFFGAFDRSAITVQLRGMSDGKISGYSEHFGEVTLPVNVFRRIEFNIYDDKYEEEEEDDFPF